MRMGALGSTETSISIYHITRHYVIQTITIWTLLKVEVYKLPGFDFCVCLLFCFSLCLCLLYNWPLEIAKCLTCISIKIKLFLIQSQ
jgi:hypothetical protein